MKEYWMKDFSQLQNSQSSCGTMKKGTKMGPRRAQTALAIGARVLGGLVVVWCPGA